MKRCYGHRPSPADQRDKVADVTGLEILPSVDLSKGPMPLVFDQGQLGSCTANAVAAALQFDLSLDRHLAGESSARRRSRLDIYYGERALEGELGQGDTGAYGRDGFKFAQQTGVLLDQRWPYTMLDDGTVEGWEGPPPSGYKRYKLTKPYAHPAQDVNTIKALLSNQQTLAFGFTAYESFESSATARTGMVSMPLRTEAVVGGHEMLVVGYPEDEPDYCKVRNSWSAEWGLAGYCLFPWEYLCDPNLANDLRTIVRATT